MRHPLGSVKIYNKDNKSVAQIREIDGYGLRQFFRTNSAIGVDNMEQDAEVVATEIFDLSGAPVAADNADTGIYMVRQQLSDGTVKVMKKAISR